MWWSDNNVFWNTSKKNALILDITFASFTFDDLSWSANTSATIKKAQHFLRALRRNNLECKLPVSFYSSTIKSILVYCIPVWPSSCTTADENSPKENQHSPKNCWLFTSLPGKHCSLPLSLNGQHINMDTSHSGNLFNLLPLGRWWRSFRTRSTCLWDSFFQVLSGL